MKSLFVSVMALVIVAAALSAAASQSTASASEGKGIGCATTEFVDLTAPALKKRIGDAQKRVSMGELETKYLSAGHKVSSQLYRLLDSKGKWFTVTTTCEGSCFTNGPHGCGVSGCDVSEGTCTDIECTDGTCASRCSKISVQ